MVRAPAVLITAFTPPLPISKEKNSGLDIWMLLSLLIYIWGQVEKVALE